jgi:type II secretory pathway pseudopilin PulG
MRHRNGFLLMEFIAALTLVSALLLIAGQWWQHQSKVQQRQQWLDHTDYLLQATERFWLEQGRPPHDYTELSQSLELEALALPWQQPWRLTHEVSLLRWHISAPSQQQAHWFASHFQAAQVVDDEVTLSQWAPLHEASGEKYLYRVARPDKPELNQLAVHLNMQQHDVNGIGNLLASQANLAQLTADSILVNSAIIADLTTQLLTVSSIQTTHGDLQQFFDQISAYEALWNECRSAGGCQ